MIHLLSLTAFGEYVIRSRHGVIFETLGSLLSLLRTGARDAYRQFFADAMLVIQGKKRGGGDEGLQYLSLLRSFCKKSAAIYYFE